VSNGIILQIGIVVDFWVIYWIGTKTLLEMHQKFPVPLGAENGRRYDTEYVEIKVLKCPAKVIDDIVM
jgi:hypothetical protein